MAVEGRSGQQGLAGLGFAQRSPHKACARIEPAHRRDNAGSGDGSFNWVRFELITTTVPVIETEASALGRAASVAIFGGARGWIAGPARSPPGCASGGSLARPLGCAIKSIAICDNAALRHLRPGAKRSAPYSVCPALRSAERSTTNIRFQFAGFIAANCIVTGTRPHVDGDCC